MGMCCCASGRKGNHRPPIPEDSRVLSLYSLPLFSFNLLFCGPFFWGGGHPRDGIQVLMDIRHELFKLVLSLEISSSCKTKQCMFAFFILRTLCHLTCV